MPPYRPMVESGPARVRTRRVAATQLRNTVAETLMRLAGGGRWGCAATPLWSIVRSRKAAGRLSAGRAEPNEQSDDRRHRVAEQMPCGTDESAIGLPLLKLRVLRSPIDLHLFAAALR